MDHNDLQRKYRAYYDEALALPLSAEDRADVERLRDLTSCHVLLHLGHPGVYDRIDRLRAQRALDQEEDPE